MAKRLQVNPVDLHLVGNHFVDAADDHASATARHIDDLNDAVSRWRGESQAAMQQVVARWEARHAEHQQRVAAIGQHVVRTGQAFADADGWGDLASESGPASSPPVGAPSPDVGLRL
ncbi:WXG100 family type VII secretion target [Mycobacterium talmoniae]|uniref:WXG100 family type VII secretion target n=1 Tax=Mycobacterium talmoniae TaxID=1858794 RepID=A0A1S1NB46_9MYCO|nr:MULTISPECIES: WXG100 family type VII secretion target [Mycobacterium]OHU96888.1 hypothetical protein BKN37_22610 [Mycobacterium talmoniae]PQM45648.1 hypothetical protein C1Y40_04179 [Mycobacterium talmoniae]